MAINVEDIQKLRQMTGAGMMDAKKALEAADGNIDTAIEHLRKAGMASAAKRAGREAREGVVASYVHGGKIGVLVEVNCETDFVARTEDFKEFARDVAMQVAATSPLYTTPDEVPAEILAKEKEIYAAEAVGKPAEVVDKIVQGKLDKYFAEVCLVKQPFVKDPDKSIENLLAELVGKLGENIVVRRFSRIELGGVE